MRLLQVPYQRCFLYLFSAPPPTYNFLTCLLCRKRKTAQNIKLLQTRRERERVVGYGHPSPRRVQLHSSFKLLEIGVAIAMPCWYRPVIPPFCHQKTKEIDTREKQKATTWGWFGWKPALPKSDSFWPVELRAKAHRPPQPTGGQRRRRDFVGAGAEGAGLLLCWFGDIWVSAEWTLSRIIAWLRSCLQKGNPTCPPLSAPAGYLPLWAPSLSLANATASGSGGMCSGAGAPLLLAASFFPT